MVVIKKEAVPRLHLGLKKKSNLNETSLVKNNNKIDVRGVF